MIRTLSGCSEHRLDEHCGELIEGDHRQYKWCDRRQRHKGELFHGRHMRSFRGSETRRSASLRVSDSRVCHYNEALVHWNSPRHGDSSAHRTSLIGYHTRSNLPLWNLRADALDALRGTDLVSGCACLILNLAPSAPEVRGNPVELQEITLTLFLSGTDAMRSVRLAQRVLTVTTECSAGAVQLAVSDRGTGMDPQNIPEMLQPFSTKRGGLGMGLAICSEIARCHCGNLWAENNPAAGMTLHLVLPAARKVGSRDFGRAAAAANGATLDARLFED